VTRQLVRILTLTLGWLCIVLGVVGLFLPLLQGVLLILLGLYLLSRESITGKRWMDRLQARFPEADARMQRLKNRLGFKDTGSPE